MKTPQISVLVPVHNGEKYVGRCIRSLMAQTLNKGSYEVVVINDGSTDRTKYALELFGDEIRVFTHEKKRGLPAALNTGIKQMRGRFMIRLDSDDYVHAEYLNILHLYLSLNPDIDAVAYDYLEVDDHEQVLRRANCDEEPIGCGIMFRVEQLIDVGLYDEEMLLNEDKDLRHRFEKKYKVIRVPLPLYRYRKHKSNITNCEDTMKKYMNKLEDKIKKDFNQ